jgi:hypothetical protein
LLDESVPRRLRRVLTGHEVFSVQQRGWAGMKNGQLLSAAESDRFEAFITADRHIRYQQNLAKMTLRIIVLALPSNRFADIEPLTPSILLALQERRAGELRIIGEPRE